MDTDFVEIEILNWDKYNPRGDVKKPSWFRFENSLIDDPQYFKWSAEELKALIYILSMASRKNSSRVMLYLEHAFDVCSVAEDTLRNVLQKMVLKQTLTILNESRAESARVRVQDPHATGRTDGTGRDERTTTTTPAAKLNLPEEIKTAYGVWTETLASLDVPGSPIAPPQENSIARAIRQIGFENVCLALEGQRHEKPNDKFDPRRHLSVDRCLHRDRNGKTRWEEFKNMALAVRWRIAADEQGRADAEALP